MNCNNKGLRKIYRAVRKDYTIPTMSDASDKWVYLECVPWSSIQNHWRVETTDIKLKRLVTISNSGSREFLLMGRRCWNGVVWSVYSYFWANPFFIHASSQYLWLINWIDHRSYRMPWNGGHNSDPNHPIIIGYSQYPLHRDGAF